MCMEEHTTIHNVIHTLSEKYPELEDILMEMYSKSTLGFIYESPTEWKVGYKEIVVNFHHSLMAIRDKFPMDSKEYEVLRPRT